MDRLLLRLADRIGDWAQETRGVPLPAIIRNGDSALIVTSVIFIALCLWGSVQEDRSTASIAISLMLVLIWLPTMMSLWRRQPELRRDEERWDEPKIRQTYQAVALTLREMRVLAFFRVMQTVIIAPFSLTLVIIQIVEGKPKMVTIALLLQMLAIVVTEFSRCLIPKVPRRETKLVPAYSNI